MWFAIQLGRFVGEAPDLDGMIGIRGSLTIYEEGFGGLVKNIGSEGIHPPLMDLVELRRVRAARARTRGRCT